MLSSSLLPLFKQLLQSRILLPQLAQLILPTHLFLFVVPLHPMYRATKVMIRPELAEGFTFAILVFAPHHWVRRAFQHKLRASRHLTLRLAEYLLWRMLIKLAPTTLACSRTIRRFFPLLLLLNTLDCKLL
jgi:hypothetical protein